MTRHIVSNPYQSYEEAMSAARRLGFVNVTQYRSGYKKDPRLPYKPYDKYKNDWKGWRAFLIDGLPRGTKYDSYDDAKKAAQALRCETAIQYGQKYKSDPLLPSDPAKWYGEKWEGWEVFLNKERYGSYEDAEKAVQALGIEKTTDYKKRFNEDPMLPAHPDRRYKGKGWTDWYTFFGTNRKDLYKTYAEAAIAVKKLNVKNVKEYEKAYKQDPRLTRIPDRKYRNKGWIDWNHFLRGVYNTVEEAKKAAHLLDIKHRKDYKSKRKKDPFLPFNPAFTYRDKGWISWDDFLSLSYFSYAEAVDFISSLPKILKTPHDYVALCTQEKRLPRLYKTFYSEYYDWPSFIGLVYLDPLDSIKLLREKGKHVTCIDDYIHLHLLYRSLPEDPITFYGFSNFNEFMSFDKEKLWDIKKIKEFCQTHKITTRKEYDDAASSRPFLPTNPKTVSPNIRIASLLYKQSYFSVFNDDRHEAWVDVAEKWVNSAGSYSTRRGVVKRFFEYFKDKLPYQPEILCLSDSQLLDFSKFVDSLPESLKNVATVNHLDSFFDYIIEQLCSHHCEETGEVITLEGYSNPLDKKKLRLDFSATVRHAETTKPALPFRYIERARHAIISSNQERFTLRDIYHRLKNKTNFFDSVGEWFVVDESLIDEKDPDCVWRESNGIYELWSPVRIVAIYTQLFMPFRGSQICWLDSGEADAKILVEDNGNFRWVDNTLLAAFRVPKKYHQGFLKPGSDFSVTCHVNTNKTASNAFEGYDIPWIDARITPLLVKLRNWQIKYNPLNKPTEWSKGVKIENQRTLNKYGYKGKTCFLFRDPTAQKGLPLTQSKLSSGFAGILYLIQDEDLPLVVPKKGKIDTNSLSNLQPLFTLHSMRVSLITAFIRDAKIAPEIVQKLVGHSSIVMTIYYTKVTAEEIKDALKDAESLIIKNQSNRVEQLIRQRKMEQAKSEIINCNGEIASRDIDIPAAAYSIMDYGICPNGRTKCSLGGEPVTPKGAQFHPVPSGYLGSSNCLRCRFFYTGPAFLGGLQMITNEISLECKAASKNIDELRKKIDVLEDKQYQQERNKQPFFNSHELALAEAHYEQEVTRFDSLVCDLIVAIRLSMNSVDIINAKIENGNELSGHSLITHEQCGDVSLSFPEVSDFLHVDMICQSASYHQSARPEKANLSRSQLLDLFATKNGISPGLFTLTEQQQLEVGNEITKMLRSRLGSWDKVSDLMDKNGVITLEDLGVDMSEVKDGLKLLFSGKSQQLISNKSQNIKLENVDV
ncbi:VPA1269 family protein [Pseudoalteromonas sp. M58]|uniref:gamma-mobile-trio integrase GmtZ n=1 Tax=Pseudoalteromonas sp. M58 TaxID=3141534 RepID=UPI00366CF265